MKNGKELLTSFKVIEELEKRGYKISRTSLMKYVQKGYIPEDFILIERKLKRKFYYFKPEVVDYLVQKLSET